MILGGFPIPAEIASIPSYHIMVAAVTEDQLSTVKTYSEATLNSDRSAYVPPVSQISLYTRSHYSLNHPCDRSRIDLQRSRDLALGENLGRRQHQI